jgi:lysophospholipase L1-like esterase
MRRPLGFFLIRMIVCIVTMLAFLDGTAFAKDGRLTLYLGSQDFQGHARFALLVDGKSVLTDEVADRGGQRFTIDLSSKPKQLEISFTNDACCDGGDRNLIIKSIQYEGWTLKGAELGAFPGTEIRGTDLVVGTGQKITIPVDGKAVATSTPVQAVTFRGTAPADTSAPRYYFVGDSLTFGAGASQPEMTYPAQVAKALSGNERKYRVLGIGGGTSTDMARAFVGEPIGPHDIVFIWAGRNNYQEPDIVIADLATMVRHIPSDNYMILSVLPGEYPSEAPGKPGADAIADLNDKLAEIYGEHFVAVGSDLRHTDRFDNIHLVDAGYAKIARSVVAGVNARNW